MFIAIFAAQRAFDLVFALDDTAQLAGVLVAQVLHPDVRVTPAALSTRRAVVRPMP